MSSRNLQIIKSSGEKAKFSFFKLRRSLLKSGADESTVDEVIKKIKDKLYQGMSTKEIYNRAFSLLKQVKPVYASKYKLKKAIYELGPSGFPFERFVGRIMEAEAYNVHLNHSLKGRCIKHEVDIIATKNEKKHLIECKFHSEEGRTCDVKVPLYIQSRFMDIYEKHNDYKPENGWLVTNTRFTQDALDYSSCTGLQLLSWNYPDKQSLRELIDKHRIYPLSVSTLLSAAEKDELLERGAILGSDILQNENLLDKLHIKEPRKTRILSEFKILCSKNQQYHG